MISLEIQFTICSKFLLIFYRLYLIHFFDIWLVYKISSPYEKEVESE